MLIDWITMRLPEIHITEDQWLRLRSLGDRVTRTSPDGELVWETQAWDTIRSDSHQITVRLGSDSFWVQGSPARIIGDGCAVFSTGASHALDLVGCVEAMRKFVSKLLGEVLADYRSWIVTRIDVTANYALGDLSQVREALSILRNCEGGRYRVSQQAGDTVYWSHNSRLRKGKAYAKGPHLKYLMNKQNYDGRQYSEEEIKQANKLLRLELTIGSQFIREKINKPWHKISPDELRQHHTEYFKRMLGNIDMKDDTQVKEHIIKTAKTKHQGNAAYGCFLLIQNVGWEKAREAFSRPTWYRHLKVLRESGLGDADISSGSVVAVSRKVLETHQVNSWPQLMAA